MYTILANQAPLPSLPLAVEGREERQRPSIMETMHSALNRHRGGGGKSRDINVHLVFPNGEPLSLWGLNY